MGVDVDQAFIRRAVEMADLAAVRVALFQATGDPELDKLVPLAELDADGRETLISKAVEFLQHHPEDVRSSGLRRSSCGT